MARAGVEDKRAFDVMRDHITHVHVKDTALVDGKMRAVWLGTGAIDFRWVVGSLEGIGYKGDYALEYEVQDEAPETGIAKWREWFEKF